MTQIKSIIFSVAISFGASLPTNANVFAPDNRVMLEKSAFNSKPFSMIVKIGNCTGGLVGPNLVLTAYHCINKSYKNGEITKRIKVKAEAFGLFGSMDKTTVKKVITGGESGRAGDWAVLVLKDNLGSKYGYFRINDHVNTKYQDINLAGYSADLSNFQLSFHQNCAITKIYGDTFLHNCDSTGGASGSPLWRKNAQGDYEIVGLHFGGRRASDDETQRSRLIVNSYSDTYANVASRPLNFLNAVIEEL